MPPFGRSRAERIAIALSATLLGVLGFVPQLGGPGYEAALISGLLLPGVAAVTTALLVSRQPVRPTQALARGIALGITLSVLAILIAFAHGVRVGLCDPAEGLALLVLGPGFGAALGGTGGAIAGLCAARAKTVWARRAVALSLALAGPVGGVLLSLWRFYASPMVFAYDPYFGYFSGPLYDTVISSLWPLVTYRAGSLATLCAIAAGLTLLESDFRSSLRARPHLALAGLFAVGLSLAVTAFGAELGHFSTTASIESTLGRRLSEGRCTVIYSRSILEGDARRLARECSAHLAQIERFFDSTGPERVRVFLFSSDAEKGRLMGAAHTYIAKPWREEIYLQAAGFPHPVLGHELSHVVSGSFGPGPFRVAGPWRGILPDPGRIEGFATAAAPDENDPLTLEEWATAMKRLGVLPRLHTLFRLTFLGENAARAYTASGAFVRFLRTEFGAAAIRRWYGGESLQAVTQLDLSALEQRWQRALGQVALSDAALATARARFERPAFFQRRCPRVIDRRAAEANARLSVGDLRDARAGFREVLQLDPHDSGARLGLATCRAREGDTAGAQTDYLSIAQSRDAAPWAKLFALEARGDVLLREGRIEAAREQYAELAQRLIDDDRLRTLDVKRLAESGIQREAILMLLIGDELGPVWDLAAAKLGEWSAKDPEFGLADYLLAKNFYGRGRLQEAALYLDRALVRALPEPRVLEEALRLRLFVACARLDRDAAIWALRRLHARPLSAARREAVDRFAERCSL